MSVSTFGKFWEKSSIIFKVLVVIMFMVPLGVSNFVGASIIADDTIEENTYAIDNDITYDEETDDSFMFSIDKDNSAKDMTLYSVEPIFIDSTRISK